MGVSVVVPFANFATENIPHISRDEVTKRLAYLGASKVSNFTIDYDVLYPVAPIEGQSQQNNLHIFHHSECPHSILDSGAKMSSESSFDGILAKMKPFFCPKKTQTGASVIEIKGAVYSYVDFVFRVGGIYFGPNPKYFTLEVEYTPCSYQSRCKGLIDEMLTNILGGDVVRNFNSHWSNESANKSATESEEAFQTIDCISKYFTILTKIKQGNVSTAYDYNFN